MAGSMQVHHVYMRPQNWKFYKVIICPSMLCRISLLLAGWWGLYAELSEDSAPIVAGI